MTKEEILKNAIVGVVCDELDYEHGNFQFYKEEVLQAMDEYASDLQSENERLKAERDSNWISLERAKKYARHQHYLGTQGSELVEFEDWECKPPKQ